MASTLTLLVGCVAFVLVCRVADCRLIRNNEVAGQGEDLNGEDTQIYRELLKLLELKTSEKAVNVKDWQCPNAFDKDLGFFGLFMYPQSGQDFAVSYNRKLAGNKEGATVQCKKSMRTPNKVVVVVYLMGYSDCSMGELVLFEEVDFSAGVPTPVNPFRVPCGAGGTTIYKAKGNQVFAEYSYDSSKEHAFFAMSWYDATD